MNDETELTLVRLLLRMVLDARIQALALEGCLLKTNVVTAADVQQMREVVTRQFQPYLDALAQPSTADDGEIEARLLAFLRAYTGPVQ